MTCKKIRFRWIVVHGIGEKGWGRMTRYCVILRKKKEYKKKDTWRLTSRRRLYIHNNNMYIVYYISLRREMINRRSFIHV